MLHHFGINTRRLLIHGAIGTTLGILAVIAVLALNAFGLGTMVSQIEHSAFHLSVMLIKPSMLFGVGTVGLSILMQLHIKANRSNRRIVAYQPAYRARRLGQ